MFVVRTFIMLFLLFVSYGTYAAVAVDSFERLNSKIDCIIAHGGIHSKQAKVCFEPTNSAEAHNVSTKGVVAEKVFQWKRVGGNPAKTIFKTFKGHPEYIRGRVRNDLKNIGLTDAEIAEVLQPIAKQTTMLVNNDSSVHPEWDALRKSGKLDMTFVGPGSKLTGLTFGKGKGVVKNVVTQFKDNESAYVFHLSSGKDVLWFTKCWNFAVPEISKPRQPVLVDTPPQRPVVHKPPSLSPIMEENIAVLKTTVGGWGGIHTGKGWNGSFDGFKATVTVPVHTYLGLEEEQVWVGVGARGEEWRGRSRTSQYKGNGNRIVPAMLVVDWNGDGGVFGYSHSGSFNAGVGINTMHGKNSGTGYFKDQSGKEVHVRLEQCEKSGDHGQWISCLYAEGNGAFGRIKMKSSWKGDSPEKTSNLVVGGSVQYLITDHWSAKGVLEASINDKTKHAKVAVTAAAQVCYQNHWKGGVDFAIACAGPYARYGEFDGLTVGLAGNVFAGKIWTMKVAADRSNALSFPKPSSTFIQESATDGGKEAVKLNNEMGVKASNVLSFPQGGRQSIVQPQAPYNSMNYGLDAQKAVNQ